MYGYVHTYTVANSECGRSGACCEHKRTPVSCRRSGRNQTTTLPCAIGRVCVSVQIIFYGPVWYERTTTCTYMYDSLHAGIHPKLPPGVSPCVVVWLLLPRALIISSTMFLPLRLSCLCSCPAPVSNPHTRSPSYSYLTLVFLSLWVILLVE